MNILWVGTHLWSKELDLASFLAPGVHELRTLTISEESDFHFDAHETAAAVIERISREWPVHVVLCWLPEMYPPPLEIEQCPVPTVAVFSDWNIYFPQLEHNMARYDRVYCDKLGAERLQLRGAVPRHFFSFYTQDSLLHHKLVAAKDLDIVFVGSLNYVIHAERSRCLEKVAALSDRYRVRICAGYLDEAYTRLLNRARIVFNHGLRSEMNMRCFEALACGSLLFLEESNIEVRDYLEDRHDVVLYRPDNLADLLGYYLEHREEADTIAARGHAKAAELALERRLPVFFDALEDLQPGERPYHCFSDHDKCYADVMQYASSLESTQQPLVEEAIARALASFPDSPAFHMMAAQHSTSQLDTLTGDARKAAVKQILAHLQRACELAPRDATPWLNLAMTCARSNVRDAALQCYERAAAAETCALGALLMGSVTDPFYVEFRRALAVGEERPEMLAAAAATRLAEMLIERGDAAGALGWAERAAAWWPHLSLPHQVKACAQTALGDVAGAATTLEISLPLTAFHADHRSALLDAYRALGKNAKAVALAEETARIFDAVEGREDVAKHFKSIAAEMRGDA